MGETIVTCHRAEFAALLIFNMLMFPRFDCFSYCSLKFYPHNLEDHVHWTLPSL